jgi:hypothetical protein
LILLKDGYMSASVVGNESRYWSSCNTIKGIEG